MSEISSGQFDVPARDSVAAPTAIVPPGSATICNSLGAAYKRLLGRGPQDIRLWLLQPDTILILLVGTQTTSERTLVETGRVDDVLAGRNALHGLLEPDLRTILEQELHRRTNAFIAGMDVQRDVVSLVVTLS